MPKKKQIPEFKNEDEERAFWDAHDSTEYVDWAKGKRVTLSNLEPSTCDKADASDAIKQ